MSLCNCSEKLLLEIKQGTDRAYNFTIKHKDIPFSLIGYEIKVEIKPSPYFSVPALITKIITQTSDRNTIGQIYNPNEGQWCLQINLDDYIKLPPQDYYLVATLTNPDSGDKIIISGEGDNSGIFRIVKQ